MVQGEKRMKQLLKNCGILAEDTGGFRYMKDGYLGIDGETIDYIGEEKPVEAYDREKDMGGALLMPGLINCHGFFIPVSHFL